MSNKALKNFFIFFGVVIVIGLLVFSIAKSNEKENPDAPKPKQEDIIEDKGTDIYGNDIVDINGERAIYLE